MQKNNIALNQIKKKLQEFFKSFLNFNIIYKAKGQNNQKITATFMYKNSLS